MNIVSLNTTHLGSTGKIMLQISALAREEGHHATSFSTRGFASLSLRPLRIIPNPKPPALPGHRVYGSLLSSLVHDTLGIVTGYNGCFSMIATCRLIGEIRRLQPDLIHLHNLHGNNVNLFLLFSYLKRAQIPVVWTLHDCWSFTGRCPYFDMLRCDKWKDGCGGCPCPKHDYPAAYRDRTARMWQLKKRWFTGVKDMTLVTPSHWLAGLVKQSFLSEYTVRVMHNGIDLSVFHPAESDFRRRHGIPDSTYIVLGVAFDWGRRKGLDVFTALAERLGRSYQIVLVGTDGEVDRLLPQSILSIHRTQDQRELAEIYTAADVFVNPTREDNFPTVNLEALACGTPVITFNTGGSPEALDESCGSVVACDDTDALEREIIRVCRERPYSREACRTRAEAFDQRSRLRQYIALYHEAAPAQQKAEEGSI